MKTIKLSVRDRVIFSEILPESGRKIEMILCNDLLKKIEFTPEEVSEFGLADTGGGRVTWDTTRERSIDIELTEEQVFLLKKASNEIDEQGKVTRYNVDLLDQIDKL